MSRNKIVYLHTFPNEKNHGIFFKYTIPLFKKFKIKAIYLNLKTINLFNLITSILAINKEINKETILHVQYGSGCGFVGSFFKKAKKKIITIRGSDILSLGPYGDPINFFKTKLTLSYLHKYDLIIVVSEQIKKILIDNEITKKILVIPDPVNNDYFYRIERLKAKKILNLDLKKNFFFFPANNFNSKNKNFNFIKLVQLELIKMRSEVLLLTLNNYVDQKKMYLYFNASTCSVICSYTEGWPNVVKESFYCDVPVVSTNVSDLNSLSKKFDGLTVCKLNPVNFAKAIIRYSNLPRPKNLKRIIKNFDINYYIKRVTNIYNSF